MKELKDVTRKYNLCREKARKYRNKSANLMDKLENAELTIDELKNDLKREKDTVSGTISLLFLIFNFLCFSNHTIIVYLFF